MWRGNYQAPPPAWFGHKGRPLAQRGGGTEGKRKDVKRFQWLKSSQLCGGLCAGAERDSWLLTHGPGMKNSQTEFLCFLFYTVSSFVFIC